MDSTLARKRYCCRVVLPHRDQVLGADDECLDAVVILEDARQRRGHERLAEADHVADQDAAALVQVVGGDLDGGLLEFEELVAEVAGDAELGQTGAGLLGQVIGHLDVDVVRRNRFRARPTLVDDLDQFFGDVDAQPVVPAVLEPLGQLVAGVVVQHVDVEFALLGQAGEGEVAAAQVADLGVDRVLAEEQIELGVERVAEEQLDDELSGRDLRGQSAKSLFVFIGGNADHELVAKFLGELPLEGNGRCLVYLVLVVTEAHAGAKLVLGHLLHPDEKPAAVAVTASPLLDVGVDCRQPRRLK